MPERPFENPWAISYRLHSQVGDTVMWCNSVRRNNGGN
jgi:hypothetical protein